MTPKGASCMANQPTLMHPSRNKGLIAGLTKGNQWLISPDHKALFLWGEYRGWLISHTKCFNFGTLLPAKIRLSWTNQQKGKEKDEPRTRSQGFQTC